MKERTIFISYNPNSPAEQTLAVRLHTIGAVNGFKMLLPDRFNSETYLDEETKQRIKQADFFVVFSTSPLSNIVKEEIEYAHSVLNNKSKIIVIYDSRKGKNLQGEITNHFTSIYFNPLADSSDKVIQEIFKKVFEKQNEEIHQQIELEGNANIRKKLQKQKQEAQQLQNAILAVLGIGVGLMVLNEIFKK